MLLAAAADDLAATVGRVLDRRLLSDTARPVALALSGGGDSLALLLAADQWRRRAGRPLVVLTVDHGLQPQSAAWTRACQAHAARLDLPCRALAWTGAKPVAGLPAAARAARHRLLAEAARDAGARVLLMGHTADDVLEARAMRAGGSTTPEPREWSPSPAWPEGRGLFLLRPLLGLRRQAIRAWLAAHGETWIDDPANQDPRYARARARAGLAGTASAVPGDAGPPVLAAEIVEAAPGLLGLPRASARQADPTALAGALALMAVCAGGGDRLPSAASLERAARAFRDTAGVLTLAGARLEADVSAITASREAGERARGGLAPLGLEPGAPAVWDGRFELEAVRPGLEVRALAGRMARLPEDARRALAGLPAAARPGLPAIVDPAGETSCPVLAPTPQVLVRSLVLDRLRAAAGLVEREPA